MNDDVVDLATLLTHLDLAPAHLVGNSYGAMIALRMAVDYPGLCRTVCAHEPPFLHLNETVMGDEHVAEFERLQRVVVEQLVAGDVEQGTRSFVNAAVRPSVWDEMPVEFREFLMGQAPSYVDDVNDPYPWTVDLEALARYAGPILLTQGERSARFYGVVLDEICRMVPQAARIVIQGVDHDPHVARPKEYADIIKSFLGENA